MTDLLTSPLRPARLLEDKTCQHQPRCPEALAPDRSAARAVACNPGLGWSLLCNGVVLFDDAGALLPGGRAVCPSSTYVVAPAA